MRFRSIFTWGFLGILMSVSAQSQSAPAAPAKTAQHYFLLEFLDPATGHEAEFESWWQGHIRTVLATPGYEWAQPHLRAKAKLKRPSAVPMPGHMVAYSVTSSDAEALLTQARKQLSSFDKTADHTTARIYLYQQTGEWSSAAPEPAGVFYRQLVFGNALPGREDDFNRWYDGTHAADLVTVPGVTAVSRYRYSATVLGPDEAPPKYISVMDFRTDSVDRFSEELDAMGARFVNSDSFDGAHAWRLLYEIQPIIQRK